MLTAGVLVRQIVAINLSVAENLSSHAGSISASQFADITEGVLCVEKRGVLGEPLLGVAVVDLLPPVACLDFQIEGKAGWADKTLQTLSKINSNVS